MNNVYKLPSDKHRYDEASRWISKLDKGLSKAEEKTLQCWLSEEEENRELFLKMAEVWDKSYVLSRLADLFPKPVSHRWEPRWNFSAIASMVAMLVISVFLGVTNFISVGDTSETVELNVQGLYQTAIGESSSVTLPDGSQMLLNTGTSIRVNYTSKQRFFILERGEVNIDVAHDEQRPLTVLAGEQLIQAVGTAFNIELHTDQLVELVVTEGSVLVGMNAEKIADDQANLNLIQLPLYASTVSEGQQLLLGTDNSEIVPIEPEEIAVKLSWRDGNLIFRGESLEEAVAEISRYTSAKFVFMDDSLRGIQVIGLFKAGDVNGLLETLKDNFNISYQRLEAKVLLGGGS